VLAANFQDHSELDILVGELLHIIGGIRISLIQEQDAASGGEDNYSIENQIK